MCEDEITPASSLSFSSFSAVTNEDNNINVKNEDVQTKNDESKQEKSNKYEKS